MNSVKVILNFILSVLFVITPILGVSAEINHSSTFTTNCCEESCDMMDLESKACHNNDMDHSKDDCKDKCQDTCYDHASHVVPQTIQSPTQNSAQPLNFSYRDLKQTTYYQDLSLQQLIFQFWNPPKG